MPISPTKWAPFEADRPNNDGRYRTRQIAGTGGQRMSFFVPPDFRKLVALRLIAMISSGAAGSAKSIWFDTAYGSAGESKTQHEESDHSSTFDFTGFGDKHTSIDIAHVFGALAAGDRCGILIDHKGLGGAIDYLGIEMEYE